jgi:hypothetical protein
VVDDAALTQPARDLAHRLASPRRRQCGWPRGRSGMGRSTSRDAWRNNFNERLGSPEAAEALKAFMENACRTFRTSHKAVPRCRMGVGFQFRAAGGVEIRMSAAIAKYEE